MAAIRLAGVIRESFSAGEITTSDAFNVSSLGSGADGSPGYPLISVWITGRDLREYDAAITFKVALMVKKYLVSRGIES